uniref:GB1/RHD3-type G domain-containing protein n=1 Tax=Syphacia muris TaxID=451379 RepID=A0A0N5AGR3_9BILA
MSFDLTAPFQVEFSTRDQIEHRHKVRPVQIFAPHSSDPNRFKFMENALQSVLGHHSIINKKVVIVSVAGAFRKGKSFLTTFYISHLNLLSRNNDILMDWLTDDVQLQGFHWRGGSKRDTAGIWMWGEPIMIEAASGETYAVVLMDTQGTFDNSSTYQLCTTIFALSTLLSSIQIFNLVDVIQEDALQHLSLFTEYGKMALSERHNFGIPFQTLVFVVRDFKSPDDYAYGGEGGQQYLNHVMQTSPEQPEELRDLRIQLYECFSEILCFLLPHPGYRVAERNSFKGYVKEIRPIFREEIKKMTAALLNPHVLKPKLVNGKVITCRKMADFFREYARTFAGNALPCPRNILNANAQLHFMDAMNEAKTVYIRAMDRVCSNPRMIPEKKLHEIHIKHGITALNVFEKYPRIGGGEIRAKNLELLQEELNHQFERFKRLNEDKRVTGCASAMIACGDSVFLGLGLGAASSVTITATVLTLQAGAFSLGIVAVPFSLTVLFAIWTYVYVEEKIHGCLQHEDTP